MAISALYCEKGDPVLVREGTGFVRGRVISKASRGCGVEIEVAGKKRERFCFWADLKMAPEAAVTDFPKKTGIGDTGITNGEPKKFATLGEVVRVTPPKPPPPKVEEGSKDLRKIPDGENLGQFMRACRLEQSMTQDDLSRTLEIAQGDYSSYERSLRVPKREQLEKFAMLFGLDLESLHQARDKTLQQKAASRAINVSKAVKKAAVKRRKVAMLEEKSPAPVSYDPEPVFSDADLFAFIDLISDVSPMPRDRERRRRWTSLVRELYALGQEET